MVSSNIDHISEHKDYVTSIMKNKNNDLIENEK